MKRIAVVYDFGAVAPAEIAASLRDIAEPVFVVPDNDHTRPLRRLLSRLGPCLWLVDGGPGDMRRIRAAGVDGVVTYSDAWLEFTAGAAALLGSAGHDPQTARRLTDKFEQRSALARAGVESIRFQELADARDWPSLCERVGLPLVLKPRRGVASRDTHLVTDAEAARDLVERLLHNGSRQESYIAEEYLLGHGTGPFGDFVSVESVIHRARPRHIAVTGKFPLAAPFRETGHFWPAAVRPAAAEAIVALADAAARALGVQTGILHTEIKVTESGPRLIEVNGRLGGRIQALSRAAGGPDLVAAAALLALGEDPSPPSVTADGVVFAAITPAPTDACTIASLPDRRRVLALPGVTQYTQFARPGEHRAAGVCTSALDLIMGRVRDHAELVGTIERLRSQTSYGFTFAAGPAVSTGQDLVCVPRDTQAVPSARRTPL